MGKQSGTESTLGMYLFCGANLCALQWFLTVFICLPSTWGIPHIPVHEGSPVRQFLSFESRGCQPSPTFHPEWESVLQRIRDLRTQHDQELLLNVSVIMGVVESSVLMVCTLLALSSLRKLHQTCRRFVVHLLVVSKQ